MPNNWKTYKLSELTELITKGTTPSTYGFGFTDDGINFIKSESTNYDGRLDESSFVKISSEAHEKLKRSQLKENDILFSMAGAYLGKTGIVCKNHLPANTNQANGIIRVNQAKAIPKFVALALRNPLLVNYVNASGGQSAQPNINLTDIGNLEIALPPIQEQKSIASILSTIDDKIENNLAINKTLEEMAMALYKHWFVDFGPFQDGEFVEGELGRIPKGWEIGKLEDLLEIKYGKDHKKLEEGNIPVYGSGGIMRYVNESLYDKESILIPRKGTLSNLFYVSQPFWSVDTMFYSKIKDICFGKYIFYFLKSVDLASMDVGSAVPSLTTELLKRIEIIIPPKNIVNEFDEIINSKFNIIESNIKENQTLTQLRDTLLPKLISGEIRLKEFREESITN